MVHSADFRMLSRARIREAKKLLDASEWSGAYYIAGYSIEFAIKAAISGQFRSHSMPDLKLVKDAHTHDLERLVQLAELGGQLSQRQSRDARFEVNWAIVKGLE